MKSVPGLSPGRQWVKVKQSLSPCYYNVGYSKNISKSTETCAFNIFYSNFSMVHLLLWANSCRVMLTINIWLIYKLHKEHKYIQGLSPKNKSPSQKDGSGAQSYHIAHRSLVMINVERVLAIMFCHFCGNFLIHNFQ
uniref:Uncharacterized protein n=1 Tax=Romanomermis culicivorax TaxID=13658 RepID=A0A915I3M4_ROMCU